VRGIGVGGTYSTLILQRNTNGGTVLNVVYLITDEILGVVFRDDMTHIRVVDVLAQNLQY
jgi:hypothetical protein